jgi:3-(3-hydroxy-phenyl)propionate hydroxylase
MTGRPEEADVLICGLGPVGQLLAHLLGARGVRTLAVDAASGPYGLPRAAVIDDEVLRILQSAGLDRAVLADAQVQRRVSYVTAAGRPIEVLHADDGRLGHPPLVSIHQPSLERTLLAAVAGDPSVRILWEHRLERLDQEADRVVARLRPVGSDAPMVVSARWAVACDGATSPIRTALGIPFGGSTAPERWLVVDAEVDRPLARVPHPYFVGDAERPIVTLPMSPGRHRWEWMIRPGEDAAAFLDPAAIERRIARWLDGERARIERAVIYTFHVRTAARWRAGRILLAGDAAHVMPPFAGQGFASGARDAANLAWKLDAVLHGAPDGLLDTYEAERRPHVAAMQLLATRWGGVVQTTRPRLARGRDRLLTALAGTAAGDWLRQHAKPLPTYRAGAFARTPAPASLPARHRVAVPAAGGRSGRRRRGRPPARRAPARRVGSPRGRARPHRGAAGGGTAGPAARRGRRRPPWSAP